MDVKQRWTGCINNIVVLICFFRILYRAEACSKGCKCSESTVECVNANLTEIPDWVPMSIRVLELEENPFLKLKKGSLLRFISLYSLSLRNCNLHQSFEIPKNLRIINLGFNSLSLQNIAAIFKRKEGSQIISVDLEGNGVKLDGKFSMFPKSVQFLRLGGNILKKIQADDFKDLKNLRHLDLRENGLESIAKGAFDCLKELQKIVLFNNNINDVPKRIFQFNPNIKFIDLEKNNLTQVPDLRGIRHLLHLYLARNRIKTVQRYSLGVRYIFYLDLGSNEIESIDLTGIKYYSLILSNNRIARINKHSLGMNPAISAILLQQNRITRLAKECFEGINFIGELHLQGNQMQRIERGAFRNMDIERLLLYNNSLASMEGVLEGMRRQPTLLLLFENKKLRFLRAADYQNMTPDSHIYISCKYFKEFSSPFILKAQLKCSPSIELMIQSSTSGLKGNGFQCDGGGPYKCYPCKPGEYDHVGQNGCIHCPYGAFYQDEVAASSCKSCPLGQFVPPDKGPGKSPLDCLTCPKGTNTNTSAGYRACYCLPGYSRKYRFGGCEKCTLEGFKCIRDYPELRRGYWMSWDKMETCKASFASFMSNLDTKNESYDIATSHFRCNLPIAHECPIKESCKGGVDAACNTGYTGILCAVCQSGYMKQFHKCIRCPSPVVSAVQCIAYFLSFIVLCYLMSRLDNVTLAGEEDEYNKRTFADLIQSSLKILMGFYQVLVRIINALSTIPWPRALTSAMSAFEFVQFSVLRIPSLHCIRPDWRLNAVSEFWISLIAMATVPSLVLVYYAISSAVVYCGVSKDEFKKKRMVSLKNCLQSIVLFFFATYPFISTIIFHVLPGSCHKFCTAKENGRCLHEISYLRNDYSVECPSTNSASNFNVIYAYISLLLPIGLPCLLLYLLWKYAPKDHQSANEMTMQLQYGNIQSETLLPSEEHDYKRWDDNNIPLLYSNTAKLQIKSVVGVALKMTYGNYKASCWYWEFIEMTRKLLTTIACSFLLKDVKIGLYGNILLSIVFVVLHAKIWPMKYSCDNYMQLLALVSVTVNLCYSVTKTSNIGNADIIENKQDVFALGLMLVSLNSLLIILIICRFVREIAMKIVQKSDRCKCCCCCKIHCRQDDPGMDNHDEQLIL